MPAVDDELLKRIDAHMARGNEFMARIDVHMARGEQQMARIEEEMRLSRAEHERSRKVHEGLREFIREQTLRMEKAAALQARGLDALERRMEQMGQRLDDMRDQIRANTEATWRMLDRFPPNDGTAPA